MIETIVPIEDQETLIIPINVDGLVNSDLSSDEQGICGILMSFRHDQVGDLSFQLVSPSGQVVDLIGPTGAFGATDFTTWDISFLPCNDVAAPDPGFSNNWNNGQNWGVFGNYTGSYFPFAGCLEDFNLGSANGEWTLIIRDGQPFDDGVLLDFTIIFCDPDGLECSICTPEPGVILDGEVGACQGDSSLAFVPQVQLPGIPPDDTEYGYTFVISLGDSILQFTDSLRMDTFSANIYEVRGLSYALKDSAILIDFLDSTVSGLINTIESIDTNICAQLTFPPLDVTIYRIPSIDIVGDTLTCLVEDVRLIAMTNTPFSTYIWTDTEGMTDTSQTIDASIPGIYRLEVISNFGCFSDSLYDLQIDTIIPNTHVRDTILACPLTIWVPEVDFDADDSLIWITPLGDTIRNNMPVFEGTGVFELISISDNGCIALDSINATTAFVPIQPIIFSDTLTCTNDTIAIGVSNISDYDSITIISPRGLIYDTSTIFISEPGSYIFMIYTVEGCVFLDSTTVFNDTASPAGELNLSPVSCEEGIFQLIANVDNSGVFFFWETPSMDTIEDSIIITGDPGIYTLTVVGSNGCTFIDSIEVPGPLPIPEVEIIGDTLRCEDTLGMLSASAQDNSLTYQWSGPDGFESMEPTIDVSFPGLYILESADTIGCFSLDSFVLEREGETPQFSIVADSFTCQNDTVVLVFIPLESGLFPNWSGSIDFETEDNLRLEIYEPGQLDLSIVYGQGCIYDTVIAIGIDTLRPIVFIDTVVDGQCINLEYILTSSGSSTGSEFSYNWSTDDGSLDGDPTFPEIIATNTGTYTLEIENILNGCREDESIQIEVNRGPESLNVISTSPDCADSLSGSISIEVEGGMRPYLYSLNGMAPQTDSVFTGLAAGPYQIEVTDANGCTLEFFTGLIPSETFTVDAGPDLILEGASEVLLTPVTSLSPNEVVSSLWTTGGQPICTNCDTILAEVSESGIYVFTVTDSADCIGSDFLEITILDQFNIYIPTAFSPNGDGLNDAFEFYWSNGVAGVVEVVIFNRWGDRVFQFLSDSPTGNPIYWDGSFNGTILESAVFAYYIRFQLSSGEVIERKGEIQLIR